MKTIRDTIAALGESLDENVDRMAALSFDAFENRHNGRLAGAYMRIANAHRRYTEVVTDALTVIMEELDEELTRHG
jgi:hypothetical protein